MPGHPKEGAYVMGMTLENAKWVVDAKHLVEPEYQLFYEQFSIRFKSCSIFFQVQMNLNCNQ